MKVNEIMTALEAKHPGENEYLQAVREVVSSSSALCGLTIKVRPRSTSATVCSTMLPSAPTKVVSASTPK